MNGVSKKLCIAVTGITVLKDIVNDTNWVWCVGGIILICACGIAAQVWLDWKNKTKKGD